MTVEILAIGGAHIDRRGRLFGAQRQGKEQRGCCRHPRTLHYVSTRVRAGSIRAARRAGR